MVADTRGDDPWTDLSPKKANMQIPRGAILTHDGPMGRSRPEPEVIEHMLDDLEARMRHYFVLYNRERDLRKKAEENAYKLEGEIVKLQQDIQTSISKGKSLEAKIKTLVGQPIKIKETVDKIDLLYTQMDTLIQSLVGIGSCAAISTPTREAFIRLCLEYLYPCRDLDNRINTLYTALYRVLMQQGNLNIDAHTPVQEPTTHVPPPPPTSSAPAPVETPSKALLLSGLVVSVHHVLFKTAPPNAESFVASFRFDNEDAVTVKGDYTRTMSTTAKPLDIAAHVIEFNKNIKVEALPPKVPNVIPKMLLDIYADDVLFATAVMSIVDPRTLQANEPWPLVSPAGVPLGDVTVTLAPWPKTARLPAVGFAARLQTHLSATSSGSIAVAPTQGLQQTKQPSPRLSAPAAKGTATVATTPVQVKGFVPSKSANTRKPLVLKRAKQTQGSASEKIAQLANIFNPKKQDPNDKPLVEGQQEQKEQPAEQTQENVGKQESIHEMPQAPAPVSKEPTVPRPQVSQEPEEPVQQPSPLTEPALVKKLTKKVSYADNKIPGDDASDSDALVTVVGSKAKEEHAPALATDDLNTTLNKALSRSLSKVQATPAPKETMAQAKINQVPAPPSKGKLAPLPTSPKVGQNGPLLPVVIAPKLLKKPVLLKKM